MVGQVGHSRRQNQMGRNIRGRAAPRNFGRNRRENFRHKIRPRAGLHPLEGILPRRAFRFVELYLSLRWKEPARDPERRRPRIPLAQTGRGEENEIEQADENLAGRGPEIQNRKCPVSPLLTSKCFTASACRTRNARSRSVCCLRWKWIAIFPPPPRAIPLPTRLI